MDQRANHPAYHPVVPTPTSNITKPGYGSSVSSGSPIIRHQYVSPPLLAHVTHNGAAAHQYQPTLLPLQHQPIESHILDHRSIQTSQPHLSPESSKMEVNSGPAKKKQKRNKPTLSCFECVERKTKVRFANKFINFFRIHSIEYIIGFSFIFFISCIPFVESYSCLFYLFSLFFLENTVKIPISATISG